MSRGGAKRTTQELNDYEEQRFMTIQANKEKMKSLGIKRIAASLTSLVETTKQKRKTNKGKAPQEDDDFVPDDDHFFEEDHMHKESEEPMTTTSTRAKTKKLVEGTKKGTFIPPHSVAKFLKKNKKQQHKVSVHDNIEAVSKAIELVNKALGSEEQLDEMEGSDENDVHENDTQHPKFCGNLTEAAMEKEIEEGNSITDDMEISNEQDGETMDIIDPSNTGGELYLSGSIRKTRGVVYCRKLTALPPGEKLNVEFDENGRPIGPHATLYTYFLGQQVRNRFVCPVKVKGWEEYTSETMDHLWVCITKKSSKASMSRSFQKMPHYNGTKSYACLKEEIEKKNGGKCSRIDLLIESRKRTSKKCVIAETLSNNMNAVDEMNKLEDQREQGLNEKTDEQIFQEVLGKDTHGYLRAYGPGKSITQHFNLKPSRIDLRDEVVEVKKKKAAQAVEEARNDAEKGG